MGIGDFLKQATAEIGGGIGRALSDPANTIDKVAERKRLAGRQEAEDKRAEAKTISEIFTTGLAINNKGERNTYFESVGDKVDIDPKRLKSISLSRFSDEERKLVLKELDFLDPTEREEFANLIKKFADSSRLDDAALSVAIDGYVQKAKKRETERNIGEVLKTTEEPGITPDIAPDSSQRTHIVKHGETLFSIAREYYGETGSEQWKMVNKIYEANNLSELGQGKNTIYRGQELIIPDAPMPISGEEADIGVDTGIEPEAPVEPTASEKIRIKRDKYNQEKERLDNQKKELLARRKGLLTLRKSPQRKRELELIKEALEFNQEEQKILLTGRDLLQKREKVVIENQAARLEAANNASVLKQKRMLLNLYAGGWENGLQVVNRDGTPVTETVTLPPTKEHPNGEVVERPVFADKVARRSVKTGEVLRDANDNILYMDLEEALIKLDDEAKAWLGTTKSNIGRFKGDRGSAYDFHEYIDRTVSERIGEEE